MLSAGIGFPSRHPDSSLSRQGALSRAGDVCFVHISPIARTPLVAASTRRIFSLNDQPGQSSTVCSSRRCGLP